MIILVTGMSGSGKSTISKIVAKELHAKYIDLDKISEKLRDIYKQEIVDLVNDESIIENGKINSKSLGEILFNDDSLLEKYNLYIYKKQLEILEEERKNNSILVIDSIFLPIMEIFKEGNYRILVTCSEQKRMERLTSRDHVSLEYLKKRIDNRIVYDEMDYDFVINNDKNYDEQLDRCLLDLKEKLSR